MFLSVRPSSLFFFFFFLAFIFLFPPYKAGIDELGVFFWLGIRLKFLTPLKDVTAKERESAVFTVELSHDNIPVKWFKNDQRLHTSKLVSMHDEGKTHSITFKNLSLDDTSQIKVEAMGISSEAKLTVLGRCPFQFNLIALNSAEVCGVAII